MPKNYIFLQKNDTKLGIIQLELTPRNPPRLPMSRLVDRQDYPQKLRLLALLAAMLASALA